MSEAVNSKTQRETQLIAETMKKDLEQFQNKNVAYGDSFGKQFKTYGPISALVRISDKFSRIEALILGAENNIKDEHLEDTLRDLATYCYMTLFELEDYKNE